MSNTPQHVQVLDRAMDLIELLAVSEKGLGIAELSAATSLPKSTVHRILSTFADRHYIVKDQETSIYSLGYKFVEISSLYLNKISLKTEASPIMHALAAEFGATSYLGILENNEVMYLERADQFNDLRLYTHIGKREPIHCTALGKMLMAELPETECRHIAKQLSFETYAKNTVSSYEDFMKEVHLTRERGYATDKEEHTPGSSCLAVPIYDYTGKGIAAMSLSGHDLLNRYSEKDLYTRLHDAATVISRRMGCPSEL